MDEGLATHVKDIARALGGSVSEKEIERDLRNYLSVYRTSLESAKRSIVKKHGGNPAGLSVGVRKTLKDLQPNEPSVDLVVRVVSVARKDVNTERGPKTILAGTLGDETGTVPFTVWQTDDVDLRPGDALRISNAYTKTFRGQVEVHFGNRTTVVKEAEGPTVAAGPATTPVSEKVTARAPCQVRDLREGLNGVTLTARLLTVERKEVDAGGQRKVVYAGLLGDDTGKAEFSAWRELENAAGEVVRIKGAYVKSWRGVPQVGFDDRAVVEKLRDDALPSLEEIARSPRVWIEDLVERGGAVDVTVRGIVIDVKDGSGLILRCPQCRRVLRKGACRVHGEVQGAPDLRVKAVLDDGSGAMTTVFGKEITEEVLGKGMEACVAQAKEAMSQDVIRDELADLLIAQPMEVRGNVTSDEFGLMMIADAAKVLKVDVQAEARALLEGLET